MRRKYDLDETVFETIDSEEKAYWLGFILADGCIVERTKYNRNAKYLAIQLQASDKEHLEKFKRFLKTNKPIYDVVQKLENKKFKGCSLHISSTKLVEDLIKQGVDYRKSLKEKFPILSEVFYKPFIRGYWDGDGSVLYYEQKIHNKVKLRAEVCLYGNEEFLTKVSKLLEKEINLKLNLTPNRTLFRIKTTGKKCKTLVDFLYKDSNIHLDRKYLKYLEITKS